MMLSLIVAVAANGVIGRENQLPWHISEDLRYFKRVTMGKPVVMGRKTFQSIGKPLPGRTNIVVSRNLGWSADGIRVVHTINDALALAKDLAEGGEVMVIGGAELFNETLRQADRLYLTEVHANYDGDAVLNLGDGVGWHEVSRENHDDSDPAFSFVVLERT